MTDATLSLPGAINNAAATHDQKNALFLKIFGGEVLTAFAEKNVFMPLHSVRTINAGKSASFPATGKAEARYHTPGAPVLGSSQIPHNEVVIKIDDLLLADVSIYDLDEAKNHYDIRGEYADQLGAALARRFDQTVARVIAKAARSGAVVDGLAGGTELIDADAKTNGDSLVRSIFDSAEAMDEKNVPEDNRYCAVAPAQYYLLVQTDKVLNRDFSKNNGDYAMGDVMNVAGINIVKSNNIPNAIYASSVPGERNDYSGAFNTTAALVFHKAAAGTVKLKDLSVQQSGSDFNLMYQSTLMVAKYAMGHGVLRPECAVEIKTG